MNPKLTLHFWPKKSQTQKLTLDCPSKSPEQKAASLWMKTASIQTSQNFKST